MRSRRLMMMSLALAVLAAGSPLADDDDHDQDRAYRALRRGEIAPLEEILAIARRARPGTILEIELKELGGRWVYQVETLSPGGIIGKIWIDAATRAVLPEAPGERGRGKGKD